MFSPYRCRDCGHRFLKLSGGFKGMVGTALGVFAFASFVVGMYVWSQSAESKVSPDVMLEIESTKLALERAKKGNANAQYEVGLMYLRGDALAQDFTEAVKWFELSAKQGHNGAQLNLGLLYKTGRGVLQDYAAAARWFELSAQQGNPQAQYQIGTLYKVGQGVKHDIKQAYIWYNIAAARGYEPALAARDMVAGFMSGADVVEAQNQSKSWKPTPGGQLQAAKNPPAGAKQQ